MSTRTVLCCALSAALLSCGEEQNDTEVIVQLLTDFPDELASIHVEISNPSGTEKGDWYEFELGQDPRTDFPLRFAVVPQDDDTAGFRVDVTGIDHDSTPRVLAKARSRFVPGKSVTMSLRLLQSCTDVFCDDDQTCLPPGGDSEAAESGACGAIPNLNATKSMQAPNDGGTSTHRDARTEEDPASRARHDAGPASSDSDAAEGEEDAAVMESDPALLPHDAGVPGTGATSDAGDMARTDAGPSTMVDGSVRNMVDGSVRITPTDASLTR